MHNIVILKRSVEISNLLRTRIESRHRITPTNRTVSTRTELESEFELNFNRIQNKNYGSQIRFLFGFGFDSILFGFDVNSKFAQ